MLRFTPELTTLVSVGGLLWMLGRHRYAKSPGALLLPIAVALLMAWPCWFLGYFLGGYIGYSFGVVLSEHFGLGDSGALVAFGTSLGVALISAVPQLLVVGATGWAVLWWGPVRRSRP